MTGQSNILFGTILLLDTKGVFIKYARVQLMVLLYAQSVLDFYERLQVVSNLVDTITFNTVQVQISTTKWGSVNNNTSHQLLK